MIFVIRIIFDSPISCCCNKLCSCDQSKPNCSYRLLRLLFYSPLHHDQSYYNDTSMPKSIITETFIALKESTTYTLKAAPTRSNQDLDLYIGDWIACQHRSLANKSIVSSIKYSSRKQCWSKLITSRAIWTDTVRSTWWHLPNTYACISYSYYLSANKNMLRNSILLAMLLLHRNTQKIINISERFLRLVFKTWFF